MLSLTGVTKRFGATTALEDLDLEVAAGSTTCLLGPSGCGKSTLLRAIVGLVTLDAGRVAIGGVPMGPATARELRHALGYVVQEGGLFPHLTAEENVALLARHLRWDAERIRARMSELAELVKLPPSCLERYPVELSGGQRQRVGLMRALMLEPRLLLLDEPLGALDPMIRAGLQHELREIFRALGKTVVLVTHDIGEAGFFADDIVLLRAGRSVQRGSLEELVCRPAEPFVTEFVNAQRSPLETLGAGR